MTASLQYSSFIIEQLAVVGSIRSRKMFGGVGIYIDDVFSAIISSSNRFFLRIDPNNIEDFKNEGMSKFSGRKGAGMPYYEVPDHVLEDADVLRVWAQKARHAAIQSKMNQGC